MDKKTLLNLIEDHDIYPKSLRDGVEILERYRLPSTISTNLAQSAGQSLASSGVSC